MNDPLRDRITRKLETLSDEKGYQVLDYVEFLESRYATKPEADAGIFTRLAETVEDTLRAGRLSTTAISETMGFMNRAMGVLNGVAAAGKSVVNDVSGTVNKVTSNASAAASAVVAAANAAATGAKPGVVPDAPSPGPSGAAPTPATAPSSAPAAPSAAPSTASPTDGHVTSPDR